MSSRRIDRVNELILKELNTIILKEVETPGVLVTLTRVIVSKDLGYADVYFATIPDGAAVSARTKLEKSRPDIQTILNKRLRMRPLPKIRFHIDKEEQEAANIEKIIGSLNEEL